MTMLRPLAVLLVLIAVAALLTGCDADMQRAKDAVRQRLIDPDSAQFRDLRKVDEGICGQVNSKNRMGGYVGYRTFLYDSRLRRAYLRSDDMTLEESVKISVACGYGSR